MVMEKLDIDKELEGLIEKYNLDKHYPAYRISRRACDFIRKWVKRLAEAEKKILFIGMDEHALKLIAGWAQTVNVNTLLISSVEELENREGYFEKLREADKIYIVSYTRTIEILHWFWRHDFRAESIYDVLENQQIYLQMEFYRFFIPLKMNPELELDKWGEEKSEDGSSLVLYEYYYQKQRLCHEVDGRNKKRITEKLFFLAICMRNFLEAENILDTITDESMKRSWEEIQRLFSKVKKAVSLYQQDHIVIYWLDALSYEEAIGCEYLQSQRKHSVYFHNAYSVTPYTNPTCKNMFCGILQVDDLGYRIKHIGMDNSSLLNDIVNQGYCFELISDYLSGLFPSKVNHCVEVTKGTPCSEIFWDLLRGILQSEQKTVYLAHAFVELHSPGLSVRRSRVEKQYASILREEQSGELNAQLRFYDGLLGDRCYRIYMSDHGHGNLWKKFHVHFQVYHASWERQETKKLFCFLDFDKIMHCLLRKQKPNEFVWNREFVPIQDVDYYNKDQLRKMLNKKEGIGLLQYIAYKGVIKEGRYFRFKTGVEIFYEELDGTVTEPIFGAVVKRNLSEIQDLRKKAGEFPIELALDSKFKYTAYAYKAYENVKNTIRAIAEKINEKFDEYVDGNIALRMGGEHSRKLYELLTEANKRKIGGIIDKNRQCVCAKLEISLFKPGEHLPDTIKAILLSSKIYLEELKEEAERIYGEMEIIDIYQYWEQAGYLFQREFYYGLDTDYEVGFPED